MTSTGGIWLIVRRRRERTQKVSSSGVSIEMINNNRLKGQEYLFTPKKALIYSIIVGLISAILSLLSGWLKLFYIAAFVFASICINYRMV
jgi:hypothetical protein